MTLPAALRALVLLLLAAALVLPSLWGERGGAPRAWREVGPALSDGDVDSLLAGAPPALLARTSDEAPSPRELEVLAQASKRAPLYAALPRAARLVEASATAHPRAGRAAAVSFRLRGTPGDSARVYLSEPGGVVDSLRLRLDARGEAAGAFRVRPAVPGWREWGIRAAWRGGESAAPAGAWVDSAGPPRVLVRAGFPDWESKFVVRALEESGARVETSLALGRGMAVAQGAGASLSPARLAGFDAVVVLDGAPVGGGEWAVLAEYAAGGGGVLLAGGQSGAAALGVARAGREGVVNGSTLRWTLPPELAPLPGDRVSARAVTFAGTVPGASLGAAASQGGVLALRPLGRGRAAALALTETWRWRMEAGRVAEHREFWRALVDWLASAPRDPLTVELPETSGRSGVRREVRVYDARPTPDAPVPPLVVTRPGGRADTLALAHAPERPGVLRAWFVPAADGLHAFALAGRAPAAAFRASAGDAASADAWARLSLLASASGGRALPADSVRPTVERLTADLPRGPRAISPWWIFALLLAAATVEWAIRRLQGMA